MAGWSDIRVAGRSTVVLHIETGTHNQCGEKSQAPDDGYINVRNMLSIEEVK